VELLLLALEVDPSPTTDKQPSPPSQCAAGQKMMDVIYRLKRCGRQIVEAKQVIETLVRIIGE